MSPHDYRRSRRVRFGTSSFSSKDWLGNFYPEGTPPGEFLRLYAQRLDTVEVDATYYAIPSARTVEGWIARTPEHFLITAKFPRSIVHGGEGARPDHRVLLLPDTTYKDRDAFLGVMSRLGPRLGPLILQFPYLSRSVFRTASEFFARLDLFMGDLPPDFRYGIEIRNRNWISPELTALCRRHNSALVLVDQAWMPHPDELEAGLDPVTTDFVYIRLLGDRKEIEAVTQSWNREVVNRQDRLMRWADYLRALRDRGLPVLVYVNNHYAGHAPTTVERLRRLYEDSKAE